MCGSQNEMFYESFLDKRKQKRFIKNKIDNLCGHLLMAKQPDSVAYDFGRKSHIKEQVT